jgi:hypothetical protein
VLARLKTGESSGRRGTWGNFVAAKIVLVFGVCVEPFFCCCCCCAVVSHSEWNHA